MMHTMLDSIDVIIAMEFASYIAVGENGLVVMRGRFLCFNFELMFYFHGFTFQVVDFSFVQF